MQKKGLSIRYKILLILTLVPLLALGLYLVVAIGVFKKDKIAYVFDTTSSVSSTLSAQVTTELNGVLNLTQPMMQEQILETKFGKVSRAILDINKSIEWIAAFEMNNGQPVRLDLAEKLSGKGEREISSFGNLVPLLQEANTLGRIVRVPFKDERVLLVEKVGSENVQRYFLIFAQLPNLAASFRAPSAAEVYLVNRTGFVLFGPSDNEAVYLSEKIDLDFLLDQENSKKTGGTKEANGFLVSYARSSYADLAVVSLVNKEQAFVAVNDLIGKSVLFFVFLLSATTIVSLFASGTLTSAISDLYEATKKIAEGHFDIRVKSTSRDEVGALADGFNAMADEVARLMSETAEKSRMESELKTAQTVQETLFPPTEAVIGPLRISGYYEPASECGGDWWHYCMVGDKVTLWMGDATGHGAPAALITSAAKSAATIIERLDVDPSHAMNLLNRAIYDVSKGRIMMTFFIGQYDMKTSELTYVNASHEAPFLMHRADNPLKKKDLVPLNEVNSPRLGQARETTYEQIKIKLEKGDRILFYTDGIPDIQSPSGEAWGERQFIKAILSTNTGSPPVNESVAQMVELFQGYRQKANLIDDITFFMAEVTDGAEVT